MVLPRMRVEMRAWGVSLSSGGIALREPATHENLAVLEPSNDAAVVRRSLPSGFGPVLIELSPDMRHWVALHPSVAVGYSLTQP